MGKLPEDVMMLYSVVNMKLRNCYSSLDAMCEDMDIDRDDITRRLGAAGFVYDAGSNRFR